MCIRDRHLLDRDELNPGEDGWAQLSLENPVAIVKEDRFITVSYTHLTLPTIYSV